MKRLCKIITLALSAGALPAAAATLTADADTYVRGTFGGAGTSTELTAAEQSGLNGDFKTYLRFDLSGVGGTIEGAELALTLDFAYGFGPSPLDYTVYGMGDALGDGWDEASLSFAGAPGNNIDDYFDMTGSTLLGGFSYDPLTAAAGDVMTFTSGAFDSFLNTGAGADDLVTLIILGSQGRHDIWASHENENFDGPLLTYSLAGTTGGGGGGDPTDPSPVPLPASIWLMALGLTGLAGLRRRPRN